jgi:hypothetical protein
MDDAAAAAAAAALTCSSRYQIGSKLSSVRAHIFKVEHVINAKLVMLDERDTHTILQFFTLHQ